jgi:hypothetical protein
MNMIGWLVYSVVVRHFEQNKQKRPSYSTQLHNVLVARATAINVWLVVSTWTPVLMSFF